MITISTFYAFFPLRTEDLPAHKATLLDIMAQFQVRGTILIASEGINATICGEEEKLQRCIQDIKVYFSCDFSQTLSEADFYPFHKAKVRIKPVLVKIGVELQQPQEVGEYIEPHDWNALISREDVVVIDARNSYETHLGTFKGAIDPQTRKFNHLPQFTKDGAAIPKDTPIASFCTGGIRCEKYTAWLKEQGYEKVYHLKGGILKYLQVVPEEESLWQGSCYVFDDRVAVTHGHRIDTEASTCPSCGHSLTAKDLTSEFYVPGVRCRHCDSYPPSNYDLLPQAKLQ